MKRAAVAVAVLATVGVLAVVIWRRQEVDHVRIGDGVRLEASGDDPLPVEVAWVRHGFVETFAVHDHTSYVVGSSIQAVDLRTGHVTWTWRPADGTALEASGGVVVGIGASETLRVFAPFEYDLELDRVSGQLVSLDQHVGERPPPSFRPLPVPGPPSTFEVETALSGAVARWPDGSGAWRIHVDHPNYDQRPAIEVDGLIVLALSSGDVVALRRVPG